MKQSVKPTRKRRAKRNLFAELTEGMESLAEARHGKRTLRITHCVMSESDRSLLLDEREGWRR